MGSKVSESISTSFIMSSCSHVFFVGGYCGGVCGERVYGLMEGRPYCKYHYKSWGVMVGRFHERTSGKYLGGVRSGYSYSG